MLDPLIISMISLSCFLIASGLFVLGFKNSKQSQIWMRLGYLLFVFGTLSCTIQTILTGSSSYALATSVAWATVISWFVWKMELVGAFTAPIIAVTLMTQTFFSVQGPRPITQEVSIAMKIHITSAILGQTFAILACGMSLLYLWLNRKLKNKQLNDLPLRFPGISTLTHGLQISLWLGFTFITVSLLSGAMFAQSGFISLDRVVTLKVIWAIGVWLWYLSILVLKGILGYRPQQIARLSLAGFLILAMSWFGLLFVAPLGAP